MEVAVLGTGIMGSGMARSLLRAGHAVRVWNRSGQKADPLAADGATVAGTASAAADGANVVITMLYDADSVISVVSKSAASFGVDTVWLQSSTIGREGTRRIAELASDHGLAVLDAPVLGTKRPAEDGALVILASGDAALRSRVQPVLDALGSRVVWAGSELGQATALKLACNAWVASITAAVGQSVALASAFGLDPQLFLNAIKGGAVDTPYAHVKGGQMIAGQFGVSFALDGVIKDLDLIASAAHDVGVHDEMLLTLMNAYQRASGAGHGGDDMAAVFTAFQPSENTGQD